MNAAIRRLAHASLFAMGTTLLFACGGGDGGSPPPPPALGVVGPTGGTHTINGVTISVPPNALSSTITLTVQATAAPLPSPTDGTPAGPEFEIGPVGTTFAQPVTVTVPLASSTPPADSEPVLMHGIGVNWVELPSQSIGAAAVSATTTSFSPFRVFSFRVSPAILRDPADVSVTEPNVASFTAGVIGRRLSYQWERMRPGDAGFSAIDVAAEPSAATSTYTTQATAGMPSATASATEAANGTRYRLVVSNPAGTATSAAATLTVIQRPLLSVSVTGNGTVASMPTGITCGADCSERYPLSSTVTLSATPDPGYMFSGFSGDADCTDGSLTMSAPRSCTATFALSPPATATLNLTVIGGGTVSSLPAGISCGLDCTEVYPLSQVVALAATPMPGNTFSSWSGDADCADATVTMSAARSCTATFVALAAAPVIVSGPQNKSLVEGLVATFSVSATGCLPSPALCYQWERSNDRGVSWFAVGANSASYSTDPTNSSLSSAGGDHFAQFRVTVSNASGTAQSAAVTLSVLQLTAAVDVFVQDTSGTVRSKTLATISAADHAATANVATGQFTATSSVTAASGDALAYSGTFPINFINNSGAPVTIPAGALRASYSGAYSLQAPTVTQLQSSISSELILTVSAASGSATARFIHQAANVNGFTSEGVTPVVSGGGSVMVASHGLSGISGELLMPAIVVPAGGVMTVQLLLTTIVRRATADFTTMPVQLTLDLPLGIALDHNAAVDPLGWVI